MVYFADSEKIVVTVRCKMKRLKNLTRRKWKTSKMYNIIYFFNKEYLDEFISGKLHMNTLDYFCNNSFEE